MLSELPSDTIISQETPSEERLVLSGLGLLLFEGSYESFTEDELLISEKLDSKEDTYDWAVNLNLLGKTGASLLDSLLSGWLEGSPIGQDSTEIFMICSYG
jgi:hypothetical protein